MIGFLEGRRHARLQGLLSAYIDGQVNDSERARVEAHLDGCEACRSELTTLRATVDLLTSLPQIVPSRSFALTREPEPVRSYEPLMWTARVMAPVAAVLLVLLVAGDSVGLITQQATGGPVAVETSASEGGVAATQDDASAAVAPAAAPEAATAPMAMAAQAVTEDTTVAQVERTAAAEEEVVAEVDWQERAVPKAAVASATTEEAVEEPGERRSLAPSESAGESLTPAPMAAMSAGSAEDQPIAVPLAVAPSTPAEGDEGLELALWQLEIAAAAVILAALAGAVWTAR
ncbi:MAG: zf-HC2 domain-containing protein, partial [Chloroflexi bacterium]|nr:zf-HC2 domain-containing protein [Chloroflexota bacterium]